MKKILLLGLGLFFAGAMGAQVIFSGISPAAIQGNYEMSYGRSSSGWGGPDLAVPANSVQDTLIAYLLDSTACKPATNEADLNGHIAVVYRAECEFGSKVKRAEAAGAIACVIINNVPGSPISMGGGVDGSGVGIPVVMISDVSGAALIKEMKKGPVTVFIGNKAGYYADDLGMKASQILRPKYASIPSTLATDGNEYQIDLAAYVYNHGRNDKSNVKVRAIIEFDGAEIYNKTSNPEDMESGDSLLFTLPSFSPTNWEEGYYSLTYITDADEEEEYDFDNTLESDFVISPTELSYASFDESTMLPKTLGGLRPVDGSGNIIPHYSSCITFKDANASRLAPKHISFAASKGSDAADPSLEGEPLLLQIFKWNDEFTDMNAPGFSNPIAMYEEFMTGDYEFVSDKPGVIVKGTFENNVVLPLEDDQRYLFCVTTFNKQVYFGHDASRDYNFNLEHYLQPMFPIEANAGNFNPFGFGAGTVPSVTVGFIDAATVSLNQEKLAIKMNAYPSPASDFLNIDFNKNEVNKVELINLMGQTVATQNVSNNTESVTMNVTSIENGVYIVKVYLANNMTQTMQVVVSQ